MQDAIALVDEVIALNRAHSEPRHLMVIGDSGCGKSTLCDAIAERYGVFDHKFELGIQRRVGALMVSVPSPVTPRSMAAEMLRSIGVSRTLNGTTRELSEELIGHLKQCDVRVVVLDEFQHLLSVGENKLLHTSKQLREVQDWIKSIIVKSGVTFLLIGLPISMALIQSEPQLARRFNRVCRLRPFPLPQEGQLGEMGAFADDLLVHVINHSSQIEGGISFNSDLDNSVRLYAATKGIPSTIKDLVVGAVRSAIRNGDRQVDLRHFALAYGPVCASLRVNQELRKVFGDPEVPGALINPFEDSLDSVRMQILPMAA